MHGIESLLGELARAIALAAEAVAIALIAVGMVEALVAIVRAILSRDGHRRRREIWLGFSNSPVAALTFQLASDIVSTSFSPSWDEVGRLAAIAAIRTFLSYFLDREVENARRDAPSAAVGARMNHGG